MKKKVSVLVGIALAIMLLVGCATILVEQPRERIEGFPGMSAEVLFDQSNLWVAETFVSWEDVTTFSDEDTGTIKFNGIIGDTKYMLTEFFTKVSFTIYIKEEKTKFVADVGIPYAFDSYGNKVNTLPQSGVDEIESKLKTIIDSYPDFILNKENREDW